MRDKKIKKIVRERYAEIARQESSCCGPAQSCCGSPDREQDIGKNIGYTEEDLKGVPEGANLGLGCGNPVALATLKEGETVLDLGSGAGFDCFLASNIVGKKGKVIGFISRRDIFLRGSVRLSKESGKSRASTVDKIMKQLVVVVTHEKTTKEVAKFMIDRHVIRLPIVDNERTMKLVGIVDAEDILRAYVGV